jgi:hypothetical protein
MTFQLEVLLKQRINLVTSSSLVKQDENQKSSGQFVIGKMD